jgi:PAS domain S-box-containing protein
MQTFYKRFSIIAGFVLLLVVLVLNTLVIRRQLGVQVGNQVWVAHTQQVLLELSQTESLLTDAETGQRGFLYTGDPKYLAPYDRAVDQIDSHLEKLAQLTADNPVEQARIPALRAIAQNKLADLSQTISLYRAGQADAAKEMVLSDAGLVTMDHFRQLIGEMRQQETALEEIRTAAYRKTVRVTIACIYLASILAALGLIFLARYILREMGLREQHAAEIRRREEWFRVTLTSIGDAVIATDAYGQVTFLNSLAEQLTGIKLEEAKGNPIAEVFPIFNEYTHEPVENPVKKVVEQGAVIGLANHTVLQSRDGKLIPIEDSAAPIRDDQGKLVGVVLVFRDATHERKSQEILRKTEKLATAARLAATVAHEINNPLEAVGNLIYIAKAIPGMPADAVLQLSLAEQELERVSHITRQTLGFYRESSAPDRIELPDLVESVLKLYSSKFKSKHISIECDFAECPPIHGLPGELKQLISNLVSNAADAVSSNGTIKVTLQPVETPNGKAAQLVIEDDGHGIAAENADRIFEPFFTTKKDVGTGLGLWVAREIVERHRGSIQVHSRKDNGSRGAVFTVLLPCSADVRSRAAQAPGG